MILDHYQGMMSIPSDESLLLVGCHIPYLCMKCEDSSIRYRISFTQFLETCLTLKSYSDLFVNFQCNPNETLMPPSILNIEHSILNSIRYQIWQMSPVEAVLELFAVFQLDSERSFDLRHLLQASCFNAYLL